MFCNHEVDLDRFIDEQNNYRHYILFTIHLNYLIELLIPN